MHQILGNQSTIMKQSIANFVSDSHLSSFCQEFDTEHIKLTIATSDPTATDF